MVTCNELLNISTGKDITHMNMLIICFCYLDHKVSAIAGSNFSSKIYSLMLNVNILILNLCGTAPSEDIFHTLPKRSGASKLW